MSEERIRELERDLAAAKALVETMNVARGRAEFHRSAVLRTLAESNAMVAEFVELVSSSAPLGWVANQDMEGAGEWEKRAAALLKRSAEPTEADLLERTLAATLACFPRCGVGEKSDEGQPPKLCTELSLSRLILRIGDERRPVAQGCQAHMSQVAEDRNKTTNTSSFEVELRPEAATLTTAMDMLRQRQLLRSRG